MICSCICRKTCSQARNQIQDVWVPFPTLTIGMSSVISKCSNHEVSLQILFRVYLTVICLFKKNASHALPEKNSAWTWLTQPKFWKQDLGALGDCPSLVLLILWFLRHFFHKKEMCFVLLECLQVFVWEIQDYKGTHFKHHTGCASALYSATTSKLPSCCVS